jgi:hypothetical protein
MSVPAAAGVRVRERQEHAMSVVALTFEYFGTTLEKKAVVLFLEDAACKSWRELP